MYAGSIEDDIKQLRMIQRACRRIGSEYAEFQEGDSDLFSQDSGTAAREWQKQEAFHHVSAVKVAAH